MRRLPRGAAGIPKWTPSRSEESIIGGTFAPLGNETSSWPIETNRMVSDVLVEVRQSEQEFKHAIPLLGIWIAGSLFETLHNCKGIGEEPFEAFWITGHAAMALVESLIRAKERFVEKMIEAKMLGCESRGHRFCTRGPWA
jgi:hypothetical protein